VSHVHLINREFENIRLEYLQLFTKLSEFHPVFNSAFYYKGGADYRPAFYDGAMLKGEVGTDKYFIRVTGEARKNPRWGYKYIEKDEINLTGYAFKYFGTTSFDDPNANLYLGVGETTNKSKADTSLYALTDKTFFALELPDELTGDGVEQYGIGRNNDFGTDTLVRRINRKYSDEQIAILERLYYKFKISDYFKYQWNDNYVVLEEHGATARYGYTQDAWAKSRQLQYAKFYLRNTYEKGGVDYYALLDRIIDSNFHHLTQITGLSLTDTLRASVEKSHTGITDKQDVQGFGVVKLGIDDYNWYAIGEVKSTNPRTSGFAIETLTEPLYRRFETLDEGSVEGDEPDTVMFYQARMDGLDGSRSYLYEDQHSGYSYNSNTYEPGTTQYGNGIRYLGAINNKLDESRIGQDPVHPHNFAMYVDTAYVNRGTGRIKPQYLLVVDPKKDIGYDGCPTCGDGAPAVPYVYGRYLRNMADSAWVTPPNGQIKYEKYMWKTKWNRLAFVNAIHAGDSLYILAERTIVSPDGTVTDPITQFCEKGGAYDGKLNFKKLQAEEGKKVAKIVNLANNRHKDEVFSFRFVERQYNPNGTVNTAASKEFYIESETTNRDTGKGRMIAPMEGGWIKIQDYVPIITRGAYHDVIIQAEVFDVEKTTK
jgi:hypothetical protein